MKGISDTGSANVTLLLLASQAVASTRALSACRTSNKVAVVIIQASFARRIGAFGKRQVLQVPDRFNDGVKVRSRADGH